jgi:hypothetical protein
MSSVKLFTGSVLAGALASVLAIPTAAAQTAGLVSVMVNDEAPLTVPSSPAPGFSYVAGATTNTLSVYTDGFLFCTNLALGGSWNTEVTLAPLHLDQSFSPAHPWTLPTASDIQNIVYTGSELNINRDAHGAMASSLVCHSVGAKGEVAKWLADGIFDSGDDMAWEENYHHLINWIPQSPGFSWRAPDWTQVPTNPCFSSGGQPARVVETVACAAATGVGPGTSAASVRAGTMWTWTDGINFTYLFRVDVRFGAQLPGIPPTQFEAPTRVSSTDVVDATTSGAYVSLRDGYDADYLGAAGSYCYFLTTQNLPTVLNSSTCADAHLPISNVSASGTLDYSFSQSLTSFYVVVTRPVIGAHSSTDTPVVGASILVDPALLAEAGDEFIGDDVIFGFIPSSTGFPWMTGH